MRESGEGVGRKCSQRKGEKEENIKQCKRRRSRSQKRKV